MTKTVIITLLAWAATAHSQVVIHQGTAINGGVVIQSFASGGGGSITGLRVISTSPTQALLGYNAPDTGVCSFTSNEGSTFDGTKLDNDVNSALYTGANLDNRTGSISAGTFRELVIGRRTTELALDGNLYSRALQNNTLHYLSISCDSGAATAATTYTTTNLPFGYTADEQLWWPSVTNTTSRIIDPLSGVLTYPFAKGVKDDTFYYGPKNIPCTPSKVTSSDNKQGYACLLQSTSVSGNWDLWFIDGPDEIFRRVGQVIYPSGTFSGDTVTGIAGSENLFYSDASNTLWVTAYSGSNKILLTTTYTGGWQAGDYAISGWTNLTPTNTTGGLVSLMHAYDSRFNTTYENNGIISIGLTGDRRHFIVVFYIEQDQPAWYGMFDSTGAVTAAMWTIDNGGCRWCGYHSYTILENSANNYQAFESSNPQGQGGYDTNDGFCGGPCTGDGPWIAYTNSTFSWTTSPQYGFGQSVPGFPNCSNTNGCAVVTVLGQPCDPTPSSVEAHNCSQAGHSTEFYLQDAKVGDYLVPIATLGDNLESEQLIGIIDNGDGTLNFDIARGVLNRQCIACNMHMTTASNITGFGMMPNSVAGGNTGGLFSNQKFWTPSTDPHGANLLFDSGVGYGNTINNTIQTHSTPSVNMFGGFVDWWQCEAWNLDFNSQCFGFKPGANLTYMATIPLVIAPKVLPFAGYYNYNSEQDSYITGTPSNPTVPNPDFLLVANSLCNTNGNCVPNTWTLKTGSIYKVTGISGSYAGDYAKLWPLETSCNGTSMRDVSSPGTSNSGPVPVLTIATTYCVARATGECYAASAVGDVFANCSAGVGDPSKTYITVMAGGAGKYVQYTWDDTSGTARNGRVLTSTGRNKLGCSSGGCGYWNGRSLPGGAYGLGYAITVPGLAQPVISLFKFPPMLTPDGFDRSTFIPVSVAVPPVAGASSVKVAFGYQENENDGGQPAYYCTSRQEVCYANGSALSNPYFYFSAENPSGLPCGSGCTVVVPGLSEHTLYYRMEYNNGIKSSQQVVQIP